jgi:hypothetical protein
MCQPRTPAIRASNIAASMLRFLLKLMICSSCILNAAGTGPCSTILMNFGESGLKRTAGHWKNEPARASLERTPSVYPEARSRSIQC